MVEAPSLTSFRLGSTIQTEAEPDPVKIANTRPYAFGCQC